MNHFLIFSFSGLFSIIFYILIDYTIENNNKVINFGNKKNLLNYIPNSNLVLINYIKNINKIKQENSLFNKLNKEKKICKEEVGNKPKRKISRLEYSTFVLDIILGFIFILLPLINYYKIGKTFEEIILKICYISGLIGFILTFYNCFNISKFNNSIKKEVNYNITSNFSSSPSNNTKNIYKLNKNNYLNKKNNYKNKEIKNNLYNNKENRIYYFAHFKDMLEEEEDNYLLIRDLNIEFLKHLFILVFNAFVAFLGFSLYKQTNN